MKNYLIFICLFFFANLLAQEPSGDLLSFDRLGQSDVKIHPPGENEQRVLSASRTLQSVEELPFTIHVVTREEIFKNNYTTLVDVLKTVPGIRVSQPGSALEGETFVMRGLLGNGYTKILINDLPVKPFVVSGMAIGAQLPIKEAERIEIIFGPGASIYGADASAGVINIITSQTERPIYAQADLSIGSNQYNHLSVMFGGKIGKGKRILKFSVYGSTTEFDKWRVDLDAPDLYNPLSYSGAQDTSFLQNPNYSGSANQIVISDLPHLSKSLGVQLKYRSLNFSFSKMYRRDHSAIGLNPLAVSYADPSTFTGETINTVNFGFNRRTPKWGINTNINYIGYRADNNSSTIYVDNALSRLLKFYVNTFLEPFPELRDSINNDNFNRFFSGRRYQYAASDDIRLEQLFNVRPIKNVEAIIGINLAGSFYQPQINFLQNPNSRDRIITTDTSVVFVGGPVFVDDNFLGSWGVFSQIYLTLKKLNVVAGIRYDSFSDLSPFDADGVRTINPRVAILYKLNEKTKIYGAAATAFRLPSPFYGANTFLIRETNFTDFETNPFEVKPERTRSADIGLRYRINKNIRTDFNVFLNQTSNFISPFFDIDFSNPQNIEAVIGFANDDLSEILLYGGQATIKWDNLWPYWNLDVAMNLNFSRGREILPFDGGELDRVRMQPDFSGQLQASFELFDRFYVHLNCIFADDWNNRNFTDVNTRQFTSFGYFSMDAMGRLQLSPSFNAFVKVRNIFNAYYGGIGATGTFDDLLYNPQEARTIRLGMSYRMQ